MYTYYESNLCRNSHRNETNFDATSPDLTFNKTVKVSPLAGDEVNGESQNDLAFESNHIALGNSVEAAMDLPATNISPASAQNSSQLPDTNTTTSDAPFSASPAQQPDTSSLLVSTESAIDSAVDDVEVGLRLAEKIGTSEDVGEALLSALDALDATVTGA